MGSFIVVADGFDKKLFEQLRKTAGLEVHSQSKLTKAELYELLPKVEGLVVRSATQVNAELIAKAPKLKYVIRAGEGTDNIQLEACKEKGIKVANTPGANSNSAAEMAVALMMSLLRKTPQADSSMKKGEWEKTAFSGFELTGKKVGIVGFGRIGQIVAKRISGFEPEILFYDPFVEKCTDPKIGNARKVHELKEIFSECEVITIHLPYGPKTHHLISSALLQMMKPESFLVNAARGNIVDEEALLALLKEKKIRGAALDVFSIEPLGADSPLRKLENLLLTPHLGASTDEAQFRVGEMAVHQIKEFFLNQKLLHEVLPRA